jgi:hypothetical protein
MVEDIETHKLNIIQKNPTLHEKFKCWSCGLYQADVKYCMSCSHCNNWTKLKLLEQESSLFTKYKSARIKPENVEI